ncbi:MAG: CPBP family intramembrane glutamic endopeptidase [Dermatophilaceae bacterium]
MTDSLPPPSPGSDQQADGVPHARRGLAVFAAFLLPLSVAGYWLYIAADNPFLILFTPALASVAARLLLREGFADVSFRWGGSRGTRAVLVAVAAVYAVQVLSAGPAWLAGLVPFEPPDAGFGATLLQTATVGTVVYLLFVTGEEIGWRGFMLTRLIDSGVPRPLLVHGVIWAGWHLPIILTGSYEPTGTTNIARAAIGFMVVATALSYVLAWLRLDSGVIWPGVVAHAVANSVGQDLVIASAPGEDARLWIGEAGIVTGAAVILVAVALWRRLPPPSLLRRPGVAIDLRPMSS